MVGKARRWLGEHSTVERMHGKAEFRCGRAKHGYDYNRIGSVKHGNGIGCAAPIRVA